MEKDERGYFVKQISDVIVQLGDTEGHPDEYMINAINCLAQGYLATLVSDDPIEQKDSESALTTVVASSPKKSAKNIDFIPQSYPVDKMHKLYEAMRGSPSLLSRLAYDPSNKKHALKVAKLRSYSYMRISLKDEPISVLINSDSDLYLLSSVLERFTRVGIKSIDDLKHLDFSKVEKYRGIGPKRYRILRALQNLAKYNGYF